MSGQFAAHSAGAPSSIHDPALLATLDRLRENFARGLEKFEAVGKDLYSLPWYIVCGEPGSGKTEAVRRCKVGFPPGLQDEMQGAGGTINMHWWFTNYAVLMDTAGKLLFQEAPPGTTNEWTEFLTLLRTTRPNCPVNGLLLVIPSESLIKDTMDEITSKAGKIARQLGTIQRVLDVRFPVFVLITKCDKIVGFREFFTGVKDPSLQDQMTGWSNPAPLDTPFQMEAVNTHLAEVVQRIGRRRLGMLKDPVPTDASKRRIDEVDALFALSSSIGALAPRLRKYLETIFGPSAQSARPLFLRGIYFTSALTEGKELDTELAAALGLSEEEQLPPSKAGERERSYFLKDLFLQKVFREKGLVTRATNTTKLIKNRQRMIGGVIVAGLVAVLGISIFGYKALKSSVGSELVYWRAGAKAENWSGAKWRPVVNNRLEYTGNDIVQLDANQELPIMQYHEKLQQQASADLHIPAIYKPIESIAMQANPRRRQAQRVLFEASVVAPVVEANRDRLINSSGWTAADSERLAALIRLEGAVNLKGLPGYDADYPSEEFFTPLLGPSLAKVPDGQNVLNKLIAIHEWTYFRGGAGRGLWPADWLSRGKSLRDNQPILRGWDALDKAMQAAQGTQRDAIQLITNGRRTIVSYTDAEKAFRAAVAQPRNSAWMENVLSAWSDLATRRTALDKLVAELKAKTGVSGDNVTLDAAYRATVERMKSETGQASQLIRAALLKQKDAAQAVQSAKGAAADFTLYRDLERRLATLDTQVTTQLSQLMSPADEAGLADLDITTLASENGTAAYVARATAYNDIMQIMAPSADAGSLLGRLGEAISQQGATLAAVKERSAKYTGDKRQEFFTSLRTLQEVAAGQGVTATVEAYRNELDKTFPDSLGFPLGSGAALAPEQMKATGAMLAKVRADAAASSLPADVRRPLEGRFKRLEQMAAFAAQLAGSDGTPVAVTLVLPSDQDQEAIVQKVLGAAGSKQAITRSLKSIRVGDRGYPLSGLPESVVLAKLNSAAPLPKLEFFTTVGPKSVADAAVEPGPGWGGLRLLQQNSVRRADGKEWDALVRLNYKGTDLVLAVTLAFERALPPMEQWPAAR